MRIVTRIALVLVLAVVSLAVSTAVAEPQARASGFCFKSSPYADWRGWGVAIAHCDVQAILNGGPVKDLVMTGAGLAGPDGPIIVASIEVALVELQQSDEGTAYTHCRGMGRTLGSISIRGDRQPLLPLAMSRSTALRSTDTPKIRGLIST
jgi:hypothetical protein